MIQNSRRSLFLTDAEREVLMTHVNDYLTDTLPPVEGQNERSAIEEIKLNDEFGGDGYESPRSASSFMDNLVN